VWSVLPINTLKFRELLYNNKDNIVGIQNMGMFKVRQFLYHQHYFHSLYVYDTSNNTLLYIVCTYMNLLHRSNVCLWFNFCKN